MTEETPGGLSQCHYETARLVVGDWHAPGQGSTPAPSLPQFVVELLTPAVTAQLPSSWHGDYDEERARRWIAERDEEGTQLFARSRASGDVVGLLILQAGLPEDSGEIRLGYLVRESMWGQGFGSELLRGFLAWARRSAYTSIVAGVSRENRPSIRVLEKCGFTRMPPASSDEREWSYAIAV